MGQSWRWAPAGDARQELVIGDEQWPFPVPLAKVRGGWQFDTDAGADEMISRRIGRNELRVIDVCRDYVSMQKAYASQPRDGKVAGLYAQKFRSSPGRQDGLYWRVGAEETPSPLGDLVAQAVVEGYDESKASQPLWGYYFRVLTAQGAAAKGGARSYIVNGEMSGGFALDRLSRRVRPRRHHDLHREPGRCGLPEGPRRRDAQGGCRAGGVRP